MGKAMMVAAAAGMFWIQAAFAEAPKEVPKELQGNWAPVKVCPKKFVWSEIQDAFVVNSGGMEGFSGSCKASKVQKKGAGWEIEWNCAPSGKSQAYYEAKGGRLTESSGGLQTVYKRCD